MCGIAGVFTTACSLEPVVRAMTESLAHRGPDDSGVWVDLEAGIGLGHRRLSILDLSPLGRQPMHSACGRFTIVYNGEVYNFLELRAELEGLGHGFRGGSDTEVLLAAISQWGVRAAVSRFIGMFAFALWDHETRTLTLVRDRLGIKPLYYGWTDAGFVFASELKAFRRCLDFDPSVDRDALALYFRYNYIPAPWTIYERARKLEPGIILTITQPTAEPVLEAYWSAADVWNSGEMHPFAGTMDEAVDGLEALLGEATRSRMIADVPLGALLSGGIDSSAVVALMQAHSERPVQTFSIGFHEAQYNEAAHAKAVAAHLGTAHTELYLTPKDMLDVVPQIPRFWDEPFADSSQIPTYCVSALTRGHVTVALSGDGGDELFAGYQRYFWMDRWRMVDRIPSWIRRLFAPVAGVLPPQALRLLGPWGNKVRWRVDMLGIKDFAEFYRYFMSHNQHPCEFVRGAREPVSPMTKIYDLGFRDHFKLMTFWDSVAYLPDDILTKTDRASMAVGLELRVPILDHRVVEFAAALPISMKVVGGEGKQVLRRLLYRHVPREIVDRPKMGFGVPVKEWLGGELKPWCCDMLTTSRIREQGYVDAAEVQRMVKAFFSGESGRCQQLWNMLMFQAWLDEYGA
jgi:asparagine synthase (glutamine-hydrolysing)